MVLAFSNVLLLTAFFSSLGVNAIPRQDRHFVIQISSEDPKIDNSYLLAQKRSPTYGTVLDFSDDSATPFYYGKHGGIRSAKGRPRFAEQTSDQDDSRVYFSTIAYAKEVGSGFNNVTCTKGAKVPEVAPKAREFSCSCADRTGLYGCVGTGESSGLFMYNTENPPLGPTEDPDNCAIISGLTYIPIDRSPVIENLKLVSVD